MNWLRRTNGMGPYTNGGKYANGFAYMATGGVLATHGFAWGLLTNVVGIILAGVIDAMFGGAA